MTDGGHDGRHRPPGRVLMMRRQPVHRRPLGLGGPGEYVDDGAESAVTREVLEETRWLAGGVEHLVMYQPLPGWACGPSGR
jgi:ADP-ribose pyrophosphatase YjhB (NUDIX family)